MPPKAIGIAYDTYKPMVAIDVAAAKATLEPRDGKARINARTAASPSVLIGVLFFGVT